MKRRSRPLSLFSSLTLCTLLLAACQPGQQLRKANVDQVADGMARKQVESILGMPTTIDTKDLGLSKKTTYIYTQEKGTVTIVFKDDKVQSKESTLPE